MQVSMDYTRHKLIATVEKGPHSKVWSCVICPTDCDVNEQCSEVVSTDVWMKIHLNLLNTNQLAPMVLDEMYERTDDAEIL